MVSIAAGEVGFVLDSSINYPPCYYIGKPVIMVVKVDFISSLC